MQVIPIIIPTLCRCEKLSTLLESLEANPFAKYTDVYIYIDYPAKQEHVDGYHKIVSMLEKKTWDKFYGCNIIKRDRNYGFLQNRRSAIGDVIKKYDRFICCNDDEEVSPNFLEYMNVCLERYKDDPDVLAVAGYSYPLVWKTSSEKVNCILQNFVASEWGMGYWRDKYLQFENYLKRGRNFKNSVSSDKRNIDNLIDSARIDYSNFVTSQGDNPLNGVVCDVTLRIFISLNNKYVLMPTISHVRDHGFDGSGVFCHSISYDSIHQISARNYDYDLQPIDTASSFSPVVEESKKYLKENRDLLNVFDSRTKSEVTKANLKLRLYYLLGEKNYHRIRSIFHNK